MIQSTIVNITDIVKWTDKGYVEKVRRVSWDWDSESILSQGDEVMHKVWELRYSKWTGLESVKDRITHLYLIRDIMHISEITVFTMCMEKLESLSLYNFSNIIYNT